MTATSTRRAGVVSAALVLVMVVAGCSGSTRDSSDTRSTSPGGTETAWTEPTAPMVPTSPADEPTPSPHQGGDPRVPAAAVLRAGRSTPVEDPYYPETSNPEVDVLHYFLDLSYVDKVLSGTATVTFRAAHPTDTIRLDLSGALETRQVALDGAEVDAQHHGDGLTMQTPGLTPGPIHTLVIGYRGHPEPTPAPSRRSDMTEGLGWNTDRDGSVYTFQEPYGAFTWFPVNDHPSDEALYDVRVSTKRPDIGVFNGQLKDKQQDGSRTVTRWHVRDPIASYLTTLAIGPYRQYSMNTNSGMWISYWLMDRDKRLLPRLSAETDEAFSWLLEHAGPYPFPTFGIVVVGGQSAMETQTLLTLSRGAAVRPDAVVEHELAHQWYGDSVTPTTWQGLWLSEGWAMFMQQWYESDTGRYQYGGGITAWRHLDNASRRSSGPPGDYDPQSFADLNVYLGPAMMLDRIRQQIGDRPFERLAVAWAAEHKYVNVDRAEFTRWVNARTGRRLTPLIDRWLDSPTTPRR